MRNKLEEHLSGLLREGLITEWHNRKIMAGMDWASAIDAHLMAASVIVLLISPSFLASDYSYGVEVKRALERHAGGGARVIPLLLRPVDWQGTPLGKLQCLPRNAKPVTTWNNRDQAFAEIVRGIRSVIEDINHFPNALQSSPFLSNTTSDIISLNLYPESEVETIQSKRHRLHRAKDNIRRMKEEAIKEGNNVTLSLMSKIEQEEKYLTSLDQDIQTELRIVFSPLPRQSYTRFIGRKRTN